MFFCLFVFLFLFFSILGSIVDLGKCFVPMSIPIDVKGTFLYRNNANSITTDSTHGKKRPSKSVEKVGVSSTTNHTAP